MRRLCIVLTAWCGLTCQVELRLPPPQHADWLNPRGGGGAGSAPVQTQTQTQTRVKLRVLVGPAIGSKVCTCVPALPPAGRPHCHALWRALAGARVSLPVCWVLGVLL